MRLSTQSRWVVAAYRSGDEMIAPLDGRIGAELIVDRDLVAGTMGVNRLSGRLEDGLLGRGLAMTRMAGPPELMQQEDLRLTCLQEADTVGPTGEGISLSREGLTLMELRRAGTDEVTPSS